MKRTVLSALAVAAFLLTTSTVLAQTTDTAPEVVYKRRTIKEVSFACPIVIPDKLGVLDPYEGGSSVLSPYITPRTSFSDNLLASVDCL